MIILPAVRRALDSTLDTICRTTGIGRSEAFSRVSDFIDDNSAEWRNGEPDIEYGNPFCRLAYLYMNVPAHSELVRRAFNCFPNLWSEIGQRDDLGSLGISAMGGGPGAELLGFSEFVCRKNFSNTPVITDFLLVDRVAEWDETWHILKDSVDRTLLEQYGKDRQQWPVFTSRSFLPMSLTDPDQFNAFSVRFRGIRIYILSYVASELLHLVPSLTDVIEYLSSISSPGAKILFIDRSQPEVISATKQIIEDIEGLRSCELIKRREEWDVNFEDLGDWYLQIPRLPRSTWQAFFHLAELA